MPSLAEALRFVRDPRTTADRLRHACGLLYLDTSGSADQLRTRLLDYLESLDEQQAVVCLNPKLTS